jgi:hypothetical protein
MPYRSSQRSQWPVLALAGVPLAVLALVAWLGIRAYRTQQRLLDQALTALAPFDSADTRTAAAHRAAEALGCPFPAPTPSATPEEIQRRISRELQAEIQRQFPPRAFSEGVLAINRRFSPAQPGNPVTFQLALENRTVTGTYQGRQTGEHWVFIVVDRQKYRMADIAEEYHHLFNEGLADRLAEEAVAEFRRNFEARRDMLVTERRKTLEAKYFQQAAYQRVGDRWRSLKELHAERAEDLYQEAERTFAKNRQDEVARLVAQHRLLGFLPVSPTVPLPAAAPAEKPQ